MRPSFYVKNNEFVPQSHPYLEITLTGTIIYEVIRTINGKILFFEDHLERFRNSLQKAQLGTYLLPDDTIFERIKISSYDIKLFLSILDTINKESSSYS